ncbi:MAG: hypothetical protein L6R42_004800 [Xanthoria sp. 1 TBL-2021]|nr:MAG: hypothetical protein L6R42_004800 [Xanthoria sp. 1 TBL-2021]
MGSNYDTSYALSTQWYGHPNSYAQRQGRLNNLFAPKIVVVDDEKDSELERFLVQYKPYQIDAEPAVGLIAACCKAHDHDDLSKDAMEELHQLILKTLLQQERTSKAWWKILLTYQHCIRFGSNPPLENCKAMGLRNADLLSLKNHWYIKLFIREKDIGPGIKNILTQTRQVQSTIKAG